MGHPRIEHASGEQAGRIDRLARGAHRFHRYAHHPLCEAYRGEVIRIGRRARVCRGCVCAAAGGIAGAVIAAASPPLPTGALGGGLLVAAALAVGGFRSSKLLSRAIPATLVVGALAAALRAAAPASWVVASVAAASLGVALLAYRRRGPDRSPCTSCPERDAIVCAGFKPIARREAAFSRVASRMLAQGESRATRLSRR